MIAETKTVDVTADVYRVNSRPNMIRAADNKIIIFYSKKGPTLLGSDIGRISYSDFTIHVKGGTGIEPLAVSWSDTDLSVEPNTYGYIIVTPEGAVETAVGSDPLGGMDATVQANNIVLGSFSSGDAAITEVRTFEKESSYIYAQHQVKNAEGVYVWSGLEYRLNSGTHPKAFFIKNSGKIILAYLREETLYTREFLPDDEKTWEFIGHYEVHDGTIIPDQPINVPNSNSAKNFSGCTTPYMEVSNELFTSSQPFVIELWEEGRTLLKAPVLYGAHTTYIEDKVTTTYEIVDSNDDVVVGPNRATVYLTRPNIDSYISLDGLSDGEYTVKYSVPKQKLVSGSWESPSNEHYRFYIGTPRSGYKSGVDYRNMYVKDTGAQAVSVECSSSFYKQQTGEKVQSFPLDTRDAQDVLTDIISSSDRYYAAHVGEKVQSFPLDTRDETTTDNNLNLSGSSIYTGEKHDTK